MSTSRRELLQGLIASGGLSALGVATPKSAQAQQLNLLHNQGPAYKVLEVHLAGGLSCFESLLGRPASFQTPWWDGRVDISNGVAPSNYHWAYTLQGGNGAYQATNAAAGLMTGSLANRTRVVEMSHDLLPHEAAVPLQLTGTSLGRTQHAGMAAIINAAYAGSAPRAYVLYDAAIWDAVIACKTGTFGADTYPVLAEANQWGVVNASRYARTPKTSDAVLSALRGRYTDRLVHSSGPDRVRSNGHDGYEGAVTAAMDTTPFASLFTSASGANSTDLRLRLAANLLQSGGARYVCVVDPHYDSHGITYANGDSANHHNGALQRIADSLNALVASGTISLNDTRIVLTTEFGRGKEGGGTGHYPYWYANVAIGGIVGTTNVTGTLGPSQFRAGVLHAAGIDAQLALSSTPDTAGTQLSATSGPTFFNQLFG